MRAHQIMTHNVVTVTPETSIAEAANTMLMNHISGLPVVNGAGKLVGVVSESDFLHRAEIGTQRKRSRWLQYFVSPGKQADEFIHERGRKVDEVMSVSPLVAAEDSTLEELVEIMQTNNIKRVPILRGDRLVGIVTRSNLLHAVAGLARDIPDPTADDDKVRERIIRAISPNDWRPLGLQVTVRDGIVHLNGIIVDERSRKAALVAAENVAGVTQVHDHLCWVDNYSGFYLNSPEDQLLAAKAG